SIKVMNDLPAKFFEPASGRISFRDKFPADSSPFFIECIGRSFFSLIRTNPVETPHKDISKDCGIYTAQRQHRRNLESRILFQSAQVDGNNRDMGIPRFFQRPADKSDVV